MFPRSLHLNWLFKLSLLRREHLSLAANMRTNILKTLHITKRDFPHLNCLHSEDEVRQSLCV